jgi:hypothetical protein
MHLLGTGKTTATAADGGTACDAENVSNKPAGETVRRGLILDRLGVFLVSDRCRAQILWLQSPQQSFRHFLVHT